MKRGDFFVDAREGPALHKTLVNHRIGHFHEARDVGACHVVSEGI